MKKSNLENIQVGSTQWYKQVAKQMREDILQARAIQLQICTDSGYSRLLKKFMSETNKYLYGFCIIEQIKAFANLVMDYLHDQAKEFMEKRNQETRPPTRP